MNDVVWKMGVVAAMEKIAVRVPVMHGTHSRFRRLIAGVGKTVARNDPNPRAVYMATKNRKLRKSLEVFARAAQLQRGGEAVIGTAKINTKKGWTPRSLTDWGRKHVGDVEDMADIIYELDHGKVTGKARGELWKKIQKGVGAWHNVDPSTAVTGLKYRPA